MVTQSRECKRGLEEVGQWVRWVRVGKALPARLLADSHRDDTGTFGLFVMLCIRE